jgi:penicillin-binding protein 1A
VVQGGTGKAAQIGEFAAGKTGTTENYGDAWFVGYNRQLTVAVWVGYPDGLKQMKTEYHGGPVAGGTYPAEIWHDFMTSFIGVRDRRDAERGKERKPEEAPTVPSTPVPAVPQQEQGATPAAPQGGQAEPQTPDPAPQKTPAPRQPSTPAQPQQPAPQAPAQTPTPAPGAGGGAAPTP